MWGSNSAVDALLPEGCLSRNEDLMVNSIVKMERRRVKLEGIYFYMMELID